ncbi:hypothetical protein [Lentzea flaviverrucosa]|uniref:hypothetical protein n=1 Tax=Lentzea flaviverrucosa TaxID=200379 RepID=UPI000B7CD9C9|nr:hypothetical protein [Lentzea flaviverrucosa]
MERNASAPHPRHLSRRVHAAGRSDQLLDLGFVIRTLLEPSPEVVRISDVASNEARAFAAVDSAPSSAAGRARPAPADAVAGIPAWSRVHEPRPVEVAEAVAQAAVHDRTFATSPSWGSGPADRRLRSSGDPPGRPRSPVVTLHAPGDPTPVGHSGAYRGRDVRQLPVNRAGHCKHTAAEELVALRVLEDRISTGRRQHADVHDMAGQHGPEMRVLQDRTTTPPREETVAPGFVTHHPGRFPRP